MNTWCFRADRVALGLLTLIATGRPVLAAQQLGATAEFGAAYRTPPLWGLQPELGGGFGLSTDAIVRATMHWDVGARLDTRGITTGAWIGAAVGGYGAGTRTAALNRLEGGFRRTIGPAGLSLWLSRTSFGSRSGSNGGLNDRGDTLQARRVAEITDLGSRATVGLGDFELGLTVLQRLGEAPLRRTGWEASAVWWLAPSVGLVTAAGRSLPQIGIAVPGARYGTVGVRLALGAAAHGGRTPTVPAGGATVNAPHLVVAQSRRLVIEGPRAERADVMGDFTNWEVRHLVPTGEGRWILPDTLPRGAHQLNVRFDDSAWLVPAGTIAVDDGFGGQTGLFVVR